MSFRTKLLAGFVVLALVPLVAFAVGLRREMTGRLTDQFDRRTELLVAAIETDLARQSRDIADRLEALATSVSEDNRLRRSILDGPNGRDRAFLLDYAGNARSLSGLAMLRLQDDAGRILSSGHFRNEFDRVAPELPSGLLATPEGVALARVRTPDRTFTALVRSDSVALGPARLILVGGVEVGSEFLASLKRDDGIEVSVHFPGGDSAAAEPAGSAVVRELRFPFAGDSVELGAARFVVTQSLAPVAALRRRLDLWFAVATGLAALGSILLAGWLSARLGSPLRELSSKTARLDLDRLDVNFRSERNDEIGDLARLLEALTGRLRSSASRLQKAEREVTRGEMARQVNHDVRNGLIPIRNVVEHLAEVSRESPAELVEVFSDRQSTLDSGITYLEDLAANYSRLVPSLKPRPCDVNEIVTEVTGRLFPAASVQLVLNLQDGLSRVLLDPVALRRVLENLITNAIQATSAAGGIVRVGTESQERNGDRRVIIAVEDDGPGVGEDIRDRIFEDFFTARGGGTGLGLTIVRRLVTDMGGSVSLDGRARSGARFVVDLPAARTS